MKVTGNLYRVLLDFGVRNSEDAEYKWGQSHIQNLFSYLYTQYFRHLNIQKSHSLYTHNSSIHVFLLTLLPVRPEGFC